LVFCATGLSATLVEWKKMKKKITSSKSEISQLTENLDIKDHLNMSELEPFLLHCF